MAHQAELAYQVCPIILQGGSAAQMPDGMLPIMNLFRQNNSLGLPYNEEELDDAFGAFNVLPGGTLVSQTIAKYPFANQDVAANAVIREPLTLSLIMDAPMRGPSAWDMKQLVFTALKATLDHHNNKGGLYTVATPAYIYRNLVMISMTDNSRGNNSLPQNAWRFDFEKPLVTLADLGQSLNQLNTKINNQTPTDGRQSGLQPGLQTGQIPLSGTYKIPAALMTGGTPPVIPSGLTSTVFNYPAVAGAASFAYRGIG